MSQFRVALFDLDGTLVDTEFQYTAFWDGVVEDLGIRIEHFSQLIKGRTLADIYARYLPDADLQRLVTERLSVFESQMSFPFFPGALDFLADIRLHGVRCAVVTSSNQPKMQALRQRIPHFDRLFDLVLTAEDFPVGKPAPDCYLLGARLLGASPDCCVVFEDAVNGLQAGTSAGIFTIGFATGLSREFLSPLCHHVEDNFLSLSFSRVEDLLQSHFSVLRTTQKCTER